MRYCHDYPTLTCHIIRKNIQFVSFYDKLYLSGYTANIGSKSVTFSAKFLHTKTCTLVTIVHYYLLHEFIQTSNDVVLISLCRCLFQSFHLLFALLLVECNRIQEFNQPHIQKEVPFCTVFVCHMVNHLQPMEWTYAFSNLFISSFKKEWIHFNSSG